MIADKQTNQIYFSDKLAKKFPMSWSNIRQALETAGTSYKLIPGTRDIWARDYMPIQVSKNKFVEYRYDPDYLQGDEYRRMKTYPDIVSKKMGIETIKTDIVLDGGNLVKHEDHVILTDKIIAENRGVYNRSKLIDELSELFEIDKPIFIPRDVWCVSGHADGMLRFINGDTVLVSGFYQDADPRLRIKLEAALNKAKLNFTYLKFKNKLDPEYSISYVNFLQTQELILVPQLGEKYDDMAIELLSDHYKAYVARNRIIPVEVSEINRRGGALNCIGWTMEE